MKKYRLKKSAIIFMFLILVLIISIIMFISSFVSTKSYSLEYNIDDYDISENYLSNKKVYYYEIKYNNIKYNFIYESKYLKETRLIKNIKEHIYEDYTCLTVDSDYIISNPLCSKNEEIIDYRLVPEEIDLEVKNLNNDSGSEYGNYTIYNQDNNILIWNYKGFNYLNKNKINEIKLFDKDIYEVPIIAKVNNYVIVPDFEQSYSFNRIYIINLDTLKVDTWKIKYDISFDTYVLGTNNKSIYIVDRKNKIEYELVPHKKKMRIIATDNRNGIIYNEGEQEKIPVNNIINAKQQFTYKNNYHYEINDNKLYLKYLDTKIQTRISDGDVKEIIDIHQDTIYYLVNDTLYKYDLEYGERKIITFSEWKYNYKNSIMIN